ncbi:hypothetical protein Hte_008988 [Hypoxylon texense]
MGHLETQPAEISLLILENLGESVLPAIHASPKLRSVFFAHETYLCRRMMANKIEQQCSGDSGAFQPPVPITFGFTPYVAKAHDEKGTQLCGWCQRCRDQLDEDKIFNLKATLRVFRYDHVLNLYAPRLLWSIEMTRLDACSAVWKSYYSLSAAPDRDPFRLQDRVRAVCRRRECALASPRVRERIVNYDCQRELRRLRTTLYKTHPWFLIKAN